MSGAFINRIINLFSIMPDAGLHGVPDVPTDISIILNGSEEKNKGYRSNKYFTFPEIRSILKHDQLEVSIDQILSDLTDGSTNIIGIRSNIGATVASFSGAITDGYHERLCEVANKKYDVDVSDIYGFKRLLTIEKQSEIAKQVNKEFEPYFVALKIFEEKAYNLSQSLIHNGQQYND